VPTASTQHTNQTVALAARLENSDSATVYVDIEGLTDASAQDLLLAEPALHVEFDQVRQLWAVRYATLDEVAEAQATGGEPPPKTAADPVEDLSTLTAAQLIDLAKQAQTLAELDALDAAANGRATVENAISARRQVLLEQGATA